MEQFQNNIMPYIIQYGLNVIFALLILIIGWIFAGWVKNRILRYGEHSEKLDTTLTRVFAKTAKILVLVIVVILVLEQFGIGTASFAAILAAVGLAVGLAWQGVLGDFAAGIMILSMRPFKVGDAVQVAVDTTAVVDEVGIIVTEMHTFDNLAVIMPNSQIWGKKIINYSKNDIRRADMVFGFSYDDDIDKAMSVAQSVLDEDDRVLEDPAPLIAVSELAGSSVNINVRPWTKRDDLVDLKFAITKRMKERFDEEGLNMPYPTQDIHIITENGNKA